MKTLFGILMATVVGWINLHAAVYDWNSGFTGGGLVPSDSTSWSDTRTLDSLSGTITSIEVRLHLMESHAEGNNGDLYAYLYHGDQMVVLLNRVGRTDVNEEGYLDAGFNITLNDTAGTDIHFYGGNSGSLLAGTYQPDGRAIDPASSGAVFDGATRQNSGLALGLFTGLDPNGDWTLHLSDHGAAGQSTLISWGMTMEVVPEPMSMMPAALFLLAAGVARKIVMARSKSG